MKYKFMIKNMHTYFKNEIETLSLCFNLNSYVMTAAAPRITYSSNFVSYFVRICSFTNRMCNKSTDGNNCIIMHQNIL